MPRIKPIEHDDRLSIVEHLDELRTRLMICAGALVVAFALCFWQNEVLLEIINDPLGDRKPITLSPAESFTTTLTVSGYCALLICLPVILYQMYAFVLPAFTPNERKVALPLLLLVPFLFIGGVLFAYFVILDPALEFLLGFNSDEFQTEVRAREYYGFVTMTLLSLGILFQIPVGVLALVKLGITTPKQLRKNRRYAILAIAVLAAALPTIDPVTMLIEMVPLLVLYELSILLAQAFGRPSADAGEELAPAEGS